MLICHNGNKQNLNNSVSLIVEGKNMKNKKLEILQNLSQRRIIPSERELKELLGIKPHQTKRKHISHQQQQGIIRRIRTVLSTGERGKIIPDEQRLRELLY